MKIYVKGLTLPKSEIDVEASDSISDVEQKIEGMFDIAPAAQRLYFGGVRLEESRNLSDYNITKLSTLQLLLARTGMGGADGPSVASSVPDATGSTRADDLTFTVTFDHAVADVSAADFHLGTTDTVAGTIGTPAATMDPRVWQVPVTEIVGDGTLSLDALLTGSLHDAGQHRLAIEALGASILIDNSGPNIQVNVPSGMLPLGDTMISGTMSDPSGIGLTIGFYEGQHLVGQADVQDDGAWHTTLNLTQSGLHELVAKSHDGLGNVGTKAFAVAITKGALAPVGDQMISIDSSSPTIAPSIITTSSTYNGKIAFINDVGLLPQLGASSDKFKEIVISSDKSFRLPDIIQNVDLSIGGPNVKVQGNLLDNTFAISSGSWVIDGGLGFNTVKFADSITQHELKISNDGKLNVAGRMGNIIINNVDKVEFFDQVITLESSAETKFTKDIYQVALGRAPDLKGGSQTTATLKAGTSKLEIAQNIVLSKEFENGYVNYTIDDSGNVVSKIDFSALAENIGQLAPDLGKDVINDFARLFSNSMPSENTERQLLAQILVGATESSAYSVLTGLAPNNNYIMPSSAALLIAHTIDAIGINASFAPIAISS